jgi:uridine kinase
MSRSSLLTELVEHILSIECSHPVRVALDGVDAAGKTALADELAPLIEKRGRPVIRASVDGFHRPRAQRYRQGPDSPEGYYEDAFDYPAICRNLLIPLGSGGDRRYRCAAFDYRTDTALADPPLLAPPNAILLVDGVFLLRPELNAHWDYRIFVHADFEVTLQRALRRDRALFGSSEETRRRYQQRYIPGQCIYLQSVRPDLLADVVVDNNDPGNAHIVNNPGRLDYLDGGVFT